MQNITQTKVVMETVNSREEKVELGTKTLDGGDVLDREFTCNHVIVNFKQESGKKEKKGRRKGVVALCVMCGEKVKETGELKSSRKKDEKKETAKPEVPSEGVEKLALRRQSSSLSDMSEESLDSPSLTRRKESKFSLFGSRRSTSSISSISQAVITSEMVESCTIHGHKKLKYFCENHQEICCSVCVNCLHPKCDRVMYIRDEIDTSWQTENSEHTLEALQNVKKGFEEIINVNEGTKRSLDEQRNEARERRKQLRANVIKLLDDFEKKSEKQMEKFISLETQQINTVIETCNNTIAGINKSLEILEHAIETQRTQDIFVATHKAMGQKPVLAMALSEAITNTKDMHIDFVPETEIDSLETLDSIGTMHFTAEEMELPESLLKSVSKIRQPNIRSPRNVGDIYTDSSSHKTRSPRTLSSVGKYSVTLSDDKKACENVGILLMPDGKVAIIDLNNWKLKVFDSRFQQGASLKLTSGPRGMVAIGPQELAISLPDESKIQFVSVAKTPKPLRSILTEIPCYGIANRSQELVLLCDDGFSTAGVQFIDLEGNVLRRIEMKKSSSRTVLKNPWSLTLNPDGQKLCITDRGRLVCLSLSGNVIFVYKHEHLENARGVTIDNTGKFYVCGTNNVHQVSPDGSIGKIILTEDDVVSPYAICFDPEKRLLLVTSTGSDIVKVFKLKNKN